MSIPNFVIRDGLSTDISSCMTIDCGYETEFVWQMTLEETGSGYQVGFRNDRLPRQMEVEYVIPDRRFKTILSGNGGFIIASSTDEPETLGYLLINTDPIHRIARLYDLVVARQYRRKGIGTRLLGAARRWAEEHYLKRLVVETQTKNYPAITFLQAAGFRFCGYNDQYFQNHDIAVFFEKALR